MRLGSVFQVSLTQYFADVPNLDPRAFAPRTYICADVRGSTDDSYLYNHLLFLFFLPSLISSFLFFSTGDCYCGDDGQVPSSCRIRRLNHRRILVRHCRQLHRGTPMTHSLTCFLQQSSIDADVRSLLILFAGTPKTATLDPSAWTPMVI